jgi:undecaprenyl diphosphate synthase
MNEQALKHIAIIMDGNGRWAQKKLLPRVMGHKKGVQALKNIIKHAHKLNIPYLSVFAFSTENWARPQEEVSFLMKLLYESLGKELKELQKQNIKLKFIGNKAELNSELRQLLLNSEHDTKDNDGLNLLVYLNYSGQYDILQATNKLLSSGVKTISKQDFSKELLTNGVPDIDLLIRTGGESRISNFMLWQVAYAELYFTEKLWPLFTPKELDKAIDWFIKRDRRFGSIAL